MQKDSVMRHKYEIVNLKRHARWGDFAKIFGVRKLESLGYCVALLA